MTLMPFALQRLALQINKHPDTTAAIVIATAVFLAVIWRLALPA